jgi:flagellar hook-associated protein 2
MANLSTIYNSSSLYEQLISQVIAVESQPKLKLRAEQTEHSVYKGVLSDFSSKVSALDAVLDRLADPLQAPFAGRRATAGSGAGFTASASDDAAVGQHDVRVTQLARADARLSQRFDAAAAAPATGPMSFTIHIAQPEGDPVDVEVTYTQTDGQTLGDALGGIAAAINDAVAAAEADGRLAEGTGAAASVVRETSDTARLSLRSEATGYANRLTFTDTDGLLELLQVDRETQQAGTGGGAVHAIGTGVEDSGLSATFVLDGLAMYRDSNTVDDALDGVTLTLTAPTDTAASLEVGTDVAGIRKEVEAFVKAYNGLATFLTTKTKVDAETDTRGVFASDAAVRGLRTGLRSDLARAAGDGTFRGLADLGITTERDGTLTIDTAALEEAIAASPDAVGRLFTDDDGYVARLAGRIDGLLGTSGTIEQRKETADARIKRLDTQIERWEARLSFREESLRAQFAQLEQISTVAQSQQSSLMSLFYF